MPIQESQLREREMRQKSFSAHHTAKPNLQLIFLAGACERSIAQQAGKASGPEVGTGLVRTKEEEENGLSIHGYRKGLCEGSQRTLEERHHPPGKQES